MSKGSRGISNAEYWLNLNSGTERKQHWMTEIRFTEDALWLLSLKNQPLNVHHKTNFLFGGSTRTTEQFTSTRIRRRSIPCFRQWIVLHDFTGVFTGCCRWCSSTISNTASRFLSDGVTILRREADGHSANLYVIARRCFASTCEGIFCELIDGGGRHLVVSHRLWYRKDNKYEIRKLNEKQYTCRKWSLKI